jgi:spoIIIJ-associated protein
VASREDPQSASAGEVSSAGSGEAPSGRRGAGRRASSAGSETGEHEVPLERQAAAATAFLEGLLGAFDLQGSVQHQQLDEDTVEVSVTGEDLGALIGPKGSTLNAVQDLARIAVQRDTGARTGRLHVDISGYRKRRQEALAQFTAKVAAEVVESGRRRVLEPMNSADRKVVHDTVNSIAGVSSVSQGEDPDRRVVLIADPD